MKHHARLVINTQSFYGSTELVAEYPTFLEAVRAGVQYRKDNPTANMLEIYCYDEEGATHTLESDAWPFLAQGGWTVVKTTGQPVPPADTRPLNYSL